MLFLNEALRKTNKLTPLQDKILEVTEKEETRESVRKSAAVVDVKQARKSKEKLLKNSTEEIPKVKVENKQLVVKKQVPTQKTVQKKAVASKPQKIEVQKADLPKSKERAVIPSHIVKSTNKKKTTVQQKKNEQKVKPKIEASDSDSGSSINSTKNRSNLEGLK